MKFSTYENGEATVMGQCKRNGARPQRFAIFALAVLCASATAGAADSASDTAKKFVQQIYIEGVPYEEASKLSAESAVPVIEAILKDPKQQDYWLTAAVTLGMIGDDRCVEPLIAFISRKESNTKLNHVETLSKTAGVAALGYIVQKTGNRKALDYLKEGASEGDVWKKRVQWTGSFHKSDTERNDQLVIMSVLGLGLSGNKEAADHLRAQIAPQKSMEKKLLKNRVKDFETAVKDALNDNEAISKEGMSTYYKTRHDKYHATSIQNVPMAPKIIEKVPAPVNGTMIRKLQKGEVITPLKSGEVMRPLQSGESLTPEQVKQIEKTK